MRATLALLLAAGGCNFLTSDLEDQAPVRPLEVPGAASEFGHAMAALPAGSCGASAALIVAGQTVDGPQLYLVTFGTEGSSTRSRINNRQSALAAAEQIVAMDPVDGSMALEIETDLRKVQVVIDSDCDGIEDTACGDFCVDTDLDDTTEITSSEAQVKLFGAGDVTVVGNSSTGSVAAGGQAVVIPEDVDAEGLGRAVARVPFESSTGDVTEELAVGGNRAAFLFFRTGLENDCDPRDGAPTEVACN